MRKIFISMPINGKSPERINDNKLFLLRAATNHIHEEVELIESFSDTEQGLTPIEILGENIKRMNDADYIVFAEGFEEDKECRTEYDVAMRFWKAILVEHGNKLKGVS